MKNLSLILLLFSCASVFGQSPFLSGSLMKEGSSDPVAKARVSLVNLTDSARYAAFSRPSGEFLVPVEAAGKYGMTISLDGFETWYREIDIPATGLVLADPISLVTSYALETVTIQAEAPPAQQKGDTTEYNATAFTTNPDASAADLIEKMPGITSNNGQVSSQGEVVTQVLVDGKPFFGTDPKAALNNLPAEVVDKIQVFDQQSEQSQFTGFDDGQTTRTINIVTKPETRNGTFGTGFAGYGYEDRYKAGGNLNFFNDDQRISIVGLSNNINQQNFASEDLVGVVSSGGGRGGRGGGGGGSSVGDFLVNEQGGITTTQAFGVNYSDELGKKVKISSSYFFNYTDNVADQSLLRQYLTGRDTGQVYTENLTSNSQNTNHRLNLRLEYEISEKTSLIWRPRASVQFNKGATLTNGQTTISDAQLNSSLINFNSEYTGIDLSNMIMLRHKFEKPMRTLSIRLNTGYNQKKGTNNQYSELNYFSGIANSDTLDQFSMLDVDAYDAGVNVMFTENVFGKAMLSTWYEFSPKWTDSNKETFNYNSLTSSYSLLDTQLTNVFQSNYRSQEIGSGLTWRLPKGTFMARVALQEAKLNNEQDFPRVDTIGFTFYNVLPMIMYRSGRGRDNSIFAMYRSNTDAPSVSDLQDVIDNSNPLQLSSGNPELEQATQHRLIFRYNKTNTEAGRLISLNLSTQATQNYIGRSSWIANQDTILPNGLFLQRGGQFTQPVNVNGYANARAFLTYGQLINALKTNMNISLSSSYSRTPSLVNGLSNVSENTSLGFGVVLSSNISENIDFTLSSNTDLTSAANSAQPQLNTQYWSQTSKAKINLIAPGGWVLRTSLNHQLYRGLTDDFNQDYFLWSGAIAKKFFKNQRGELELSMFDILGQNTSISRNATEIYIQDLQQTVLQRYVMLSFRYQLRNFEPSAPTSDRGGFGPGGPGGERPGGQGRP
ncbi:MAG: TonB-dependent receptor family protein [Bacteroidia bacterium]|nr:TonB-dependent receptor family protein [Bacteroidia bacterium]